MKKKRRLNNEANHHDTYQFSHIPQEILQEILSRLPVKTLMRFKSVSKSWKPLISNPQFSKLHLKQSINRNSTNFVFLNDSQCSLPHSSLAYTVPDGTTSKINKKMQENDDSNNTSIDYMASCNGLLCINNAEDDLFLYNPSTKVSKKIPGSLIEFPPDNSSSWASVFYGLGYYSPSDDYKLVRICMFDSIDFKTEVKIYSRNNDTWRRIKDFPYDFPYGGAGLFVCGCLHWIVSLSINTVRCYMTAALDLSDENYNLIELPEFGQGISYFEIGDVENNLAFFYFSVENRLDIWILKEYGKIETWTRIKVVIPCIRSMEFEAFAYFQPLCVWKPGEILIRIGAKQFVVYDVKQRIISDVLVPHKIMESKIVSFVESLESPNAQKIC